MQNNLKKLSTGLPGLDGVIQELREGDNIVWQIDAIADYRAFVDPLCHHARTTNQQVTYFRFAGHDPLIDENELVTIHRLEPGKGFEIFISTIHKVIETNGVGGIYLFDSLSELAHDCYSDRMLGNFFMLTCPYLNKMKTLAYFAVLRNYHSTHAAEPIAKTTQLFIDVFRYKEKLYVHPLKVENRYSPTIFRLHAWEGDRFVPVTQSGKAAEILTSVTKSGLESALYQIGVWNRVFVEADEALKAFSRGEGSQAKLDEMFHRLLRMTVTRDERILHLAERFFDLNDLMRIRERMIGTGFIGGKTVGMLLARKILEKLDPLWTEKLEAHDSFYISSEVYYTYIVLNDCWWVRKRQKDTGTFMDDIQEAQKRILAGRFTDYMIERFKVMLEYYGQAPIVVRSSSLLEDGFGNMFAGKYESVFCANQGTPEERLESFLNAVRCIYASGMSEKALLYRAERGILDVDEQMALLVQRVSGSFYGNLYYPHIAGVGFSFNPFAWNTAIDQKAGVVRLVFGLGTRAVERSDDDYTRLVALSHPKLRPENHSEARRYSQRKVDLLNLKTLQLESKFFSDVVEQSTGLPVNLFTERIPTGTQRSDGKTPAVLTLEKTFARTHYLKDLQKILCVLEETYQHPVDIEFTVNFSEADTYKIDLLQCRPFQTRGFNPAKDVPADLKSENVIFKSTGAVIGQSVAETIDRIVYVVPSVYGRMPINKRYSVARAIGKLIRAKEDPPKKILLLGPGRWGTTMPSLGVPVSFAEIGRVSVLGEIVRMRDDLIPDVSLGTHFFSDLVEFNILYLALDPDKEGNFINDEFLISHPNPLTDIVPDAGKFTDTIRIIDGETLDARIQFNADALKQTAVCYIER